MRSRFTAFALQDADHLLRSWDPSTRPPAIRFMPGQRWLRLEIIAAVRGSVLDEDGEVEFRARYERDGIPGVLVERSRFTRGADHRWVYVGAIDATTF